MQKIDVDKIFKQKNPGLYKLLPRFIINYVKRVVHQDDINRFIDKHGHKKNIAFAEAVIQEWNISVKVNGIENLPQTGGCIVASNHPLGGIDAMAFISTIGSRRKDMKFLVNDILLHLKNLEELFLGVNKHGKNTKELLETIDALYASDQCILIFPAGLVSRRKGKLIRDLEWKKSFITKAKRHKRPVIPVHFSGRLSDFFYNLANLRKFLKIKSNIEMFYLVDELYKQTGGHLEINIGKPISPDTFNNSKTDFEWAQYVKEEVYKISNQN